MTPTINGYQYGFGEVTLTIGDLQLTGFQEITYGDRLEGKWVYGAGSAMVPQGSTAGQYVCDNVKAKLLKDEADLLRKSLAALSGDGSYGFTLIPVIQVSYIVSAQPNNPASVDRSHLHELMNCRYVSGADSAAQGSDELTEDIEFACQFIRRNGLTLFRQS